MRDISNIGADKLRFEEAIISAASEAVQESLKELGESPEAWRGAVMIAENFMAVVKLGMVATETKEDPADRETSLMVMTTMLAGLGHGVLTHPCAQAAKRVK